MSIVLIDGAFLVESEAKIPVSDRGLLFGDGAYATLQVREGIPLFLETHLTRLKEQALSFNLRPPEIKPSHVYELIRLNQAEKGIWRLKIMLTGGDAPEMHLPHREGRLLMTLKPHEPVKKEPLKITIFPTPYALCHASFKSLASLNRYYMMQYAKDNGYDDALSLTENKIVLEAAFGNLFWVHENRFFTPSPNLPLYFGVTLTNAVKVAKNLKMEVAFVKIAWQDLPKDAFYFRTNTMGGIRSIQQINTQFLPYNEKIDYSFSLNYEELILDQLATCRASL